MKKIIMKKRYYISDYNDCRIGNAKKIIADRLEALVYHVAEEKVDEIFENYRNIGFYGDDELHFVFQINITGNELLIALGIPEEEEEEDHNAPADFDEWIDLGIKLGYLNDMKKIIRDDDVRKHTILQIPTPAGPLHDIKCQNMKKIIRDDMKKIIRDEMYKYK